MYIIASKHWTLYIGVTSELEQRVWQHKTKLAKGFSAKYNCNRLVYFHIENAIRREKQLRGWVRAKKLRLIQIANPDLEDLALDWLKESEIRVALLENTSERSAHPAPSVILSEPAQDDGTFGSEMAKERLET